MTTTTTQPSITGVLTGISKAADADDAVVADAAKAARLSTGTASTAGLSLVGSDNSDNEEEEEPYWEDPDWVPQTKSGKQRTPNMIRNELQKYIDHSSKTQTFIVQNLLRVNNNSFRKFMNPKYYKNQWSAAQNGTYWAAARLLEEERHTKKTTKKATATQKKRSRDDEATMASPPKKSKKGAKAEAVQRMQTILKVEGIDETCVYDTCPQLVKKIKAFLAQDGVTKKDFCELALGGVNTNALARFLAAKKQDQAGNAVYPRAYGFFEQLRVLEGQTKSAARRKNENDHPEGFPLEAPRTMRWVIGLPDEIIPGFY